MPTEATSGRDSVRLTQEELALIVPYPKPEEGTAVPARSERQRRAAAADYERMKDGKEPRTFKGASMKQVHDYMTKPKGGFKKGKGK